MLTDNCLPSDTTAADADGQKTVPAAGSQVGRRLIVMLLLAGTLWIMSHMNHNMMPMDQIMRMQR